ncbi:MAG TPA: hypothetical protein VMU01_07050 [Rhizomicrobium sp.]|nr:hypothetical protein [Rhizomicrobium sp.]
MPKAIAVLRSRGSALSLAALFHVVLIGFLLQAIPSQERPAAAEHETQVVLVPLPFVEPVRQVPKRKGRRTEGGSNAITAPYFNPYAFNPLTLQAGQQRLSLALASCAPDNWDKEPDEVRAACAKIRTALASRGDEFGVKADFKYGAYWQQELIKRHRPVLAPCMTPGGPDVLFLLYCVYNVVFHGYDGEKMPHY